MAAAPNMNTPTIIVPGGPMGSGSLTPRFVFAQSLSPSCDQVCSPADDTPKEILASDCVLGSASNSPSEASSRCQSQSDSSKCVSLGSSRSLSSDRSDEAGCELSSPRLPRFPSFSRLRLSSSKETDQEIRREFPQERPQICSPAKERLRKASSSCLKRKRPPMLDIPAKDAFTSSPLATPPSFIADAADDIKELSADGPGFAVLCKRGRKRDVLEDAFQAVAKLGGNPELSYFGVYDGHGGTAAAEFAAAQLHIALLDSLQQRTMDDAEAAMVDAYAQTDKEFLAQGAPSGASCVSCLHAGGRLVVAHAGDCRAVMCRNGKAVEVTEDHKASREDEQRRIEDLGGHVDNFTGIWRVQGVMAVTRGIGDSYLKEYISPVPETCTVMAQSPDDFLILASDGLWDVMSSHEAVDLVAGVLASPTMSASTPDLTLHSPAICSPSLQIPKKHLRSSMGAGKGRSLSLGGDKDLGLGGKGGGCMDKGEDLGRGGKEDGAGMRGCCLPRLKERNLFDLREDASSGDKGGAEAVGDKDKDTRKEVFKGFTLSGGGGREESSGSECSCRGGVESDSDESESSHSNLVLRLTGSPLLLKTMDPGVHRGAAFRARTEDRLKVSCCKLVDAAVKRGSPDDITVLVVHPASLR